MNVSNVLTRGYENKRLFRRAENKPNSNPIQTQANGFFKILPSLLIVPISIEGQRKYQPIVKKTEIPSRLAIWFLLPVKVQSIPNFLESFFIIARGDYLKGFFSSSHCI